MGKSALYRRSIPLHGSRWNLVAASIPEARFRAQQSFHPQLATMLIALLFQAYKRDAVNVQSRHARKSGSGEQCLCNIPLAGKPASLSSKSKT